MHQRNVVVLIGHLTADPILRYTSSGAAVANFGLAVNRGSRQPDGSWKDELDGFFDCEVWDSLGEELAERFHKGDEVYVCGSLIQNKFKPKGTDQTVSRVVVRVKTLGSTVQITRKATQQPAQAEQPVGAVA